MSGWLNTFFFTFSLFFVVNLDVDVDVEVELRYVEMTQHFFQHFFQQSRNDTMNMSDFEHVRSTNFLMQNCPLWSQDHIALLILRIRCLDHSQLNLENSKIIFDVACSFVYIKKKACWQQAWLTWGFRSLWLKRFVHLRLLAQVNSYKLMLIVNGTVLEILRFKKVFIYQSAKFLLQLWHVIISTIYCQVRQCCLNVSTSKILNWI